LAPWSRQREWTVANCYGDIISWHIKMLQSCRSTFYLSSELFLLYIYCDVCSSSSRSTTPSVLFRPERLRPRAEPFRLSYWITSLTRAAHGLFSQHYLLHKDCTLSSTQRLSRLARASFTIYDMANVSRFVQRLLRKQALKYFLCRSYVS
jgi:hypothetical protein